MIEELKKLKKKKEIQQINQNLEKQQVEKKQEEVKNEVETTAVTRSVKELGATPSTNIEENQKQVAENVDRVQENIATKQSSPEKGPLTSSFENSMQYFVPHIFAGLAGLAMGGGKGALKAISTMDSITKGYHSAKNAAYATEYAHKKASSNASKGQVGDYVDEKGNVVYWNPNKKQFFNRDGGIVKGQVHIGKDRRLKERLAFDQYEEKKSHFRNFRSVNKKEVDSIRSLDQMLYNMENTDAISEGMIKIFTSKSVMNEVGNLSETDLEMASIAGVTILDRVRQSPGAWWKGMPKEKVVEQAKKLYAAVIFKKKKQLMEAAYKGSGNVYQEGLGMSKEELIKGMLDETGIDYSGINIEGKDKSRSRLEELRRKKEMAKKRGRR